MIRRRVFLRGMMAVGTATAFSARPVRGVAAEPLETKTIKLVKIPGICVAPQYIAHGLLRAEGFSEVQYVDVPDGAGTYKVLASGEANVSMAFVAPFLIQVDAGSPIVMLAGIHVGCFELVGTEKLRSVRDLKGKTSGSLPTLRPTACVSSPRAR